MKKQIAAVITAAFIFAGLTACSENVVEDQPVNFSSVNDSSTLGSAVQSSDSQSASDIQSIEENMLQMTTSTYSFFSENAKFAVVFDGLPIGLSYKSELSDVFKEIDCVKAKVTLKDIWISDYDGMGYRTGATLVSVDELL